jgi:hypothetical protein
MKVKFYYVESLSLYVNLSLIESIQLVERRRMDFELGKEVIKTECCISFGKNAFFCEESYYYELVNRLS